MAITNKRRLLNLRTISGPHTALTVCRGLTSSNEIMKYVLGNHSTTPTRCLQETWNNICIEKLLRTLWQLLRIKLQRYQLKHIRKLFASFTHQRKKTQAISLRFQHGNLDAPERTQLLKTLQCILFVQVSSVSVIFHQIKKSMTNVWSTWQHSSLASAASHSPRCILALK